jgi:hypothetical protein
MNRCTCGLDREGCCYPRCPQGEYDEALCSAIERDKDEKRGINVQTAGK